MKRKLKIGQGFKLPCGSQFTFAGWDADGRAKLDVVLSDSTAVGEGALRVVKYNGRVPVSKVGDFLLIFEDGVRADFF